MTLKQFSALFLTITPNVFHNSAWQQPESYIVWSEEGQSDSFHADNKMEIQVISGTIDFFTKIEFDPIFNEIQTALDSVDLTWSLNSIQHEEETGYTHYEWVWGIANGTHDY